MRVLFTSNPGRETLTAGVPTVTLPQRVDQPANAQRLADLGAGITLDRDEVVTRPLSSSRAWGPGRKSSQSHDDDSSSQVRGSQAQAQAQAGNGIVTHRIKIGPA
jgi:hypothetical protein